MGVLLATVFSSAGPCFYRHVVPGPDPYAQLMAYLEGVSLDHDLSALRAQEYLWLGYSTGRFPTEGISAMPSMHVAMAMLMVLVHWRVNRLFGILAGVFAFLILIGSVMLGWHYAVDGYVGAALVMPVWWFSGRFLAALRRRADER